jgi:hypothetical protein
MASRCVPLKVQVGKMLEDFLDGMFFPHAIKFIGASSIATGAVPKIYDLWGAILFPEPLSIKFRD